MSSGADLFVVCKRCGSEVSPYITECPYCGNRLRRRAPKLPREHSPQRHRCTRLPVPSLGRLRRGEIEGVRGDSLPYATVALVAVSCVAVGADQRRLRGPRPAPRRGAAAGRLVEALQRPVRLPEATPSPGCTRSCVLFAVAIFGWLLERRHGPFAVLVTFFGAGATGVLAALAAYPLPIVSGANAGALGAARGVGRARPAGRPRRALLRRRPVGDRGDRRGAARDALRPPGGELAGGRHRRGRRARAGLRSHHHPREGRLRAAVAEVTWVPARRAEVPRAPQVGGLGAVGLNGAYSCGSREPGA